MKHRVLVLSGLLAASVAGTAAAQSSGTFEVGVFGRRHFFGESYGLTHEIAGGARVGLFIIRNLELEADATYTTAETSDNDRVLISPGEGRPVSLFGLHGRLLYNIPLAENSAVVIGGGSTYHNYGKTFGGTENGPGGLVGLRLGIGPTVALRVDGTLDYMGTPNKQLSTANDDWHYGIQAGLSLRTGGRSRGEEAAGAERDADGDGVPDSNDQCAGTPNGTVVDARGCPSGAPDSAAMADSAARADSARMARAAADSVRRETERTRADSLARAREDSVRTAAERERAMADSARVAAENERVQAFRDSLRAATEADSAHRAELESELRGTRNRARQAAIRDSLQQAALRDSLRMLISERNTHLALPGVNFATGKSTLTEGSRAILDEVARSLQANADVRVEVAGHTDNTGPREVNERLSLERADAVKAYLVEQGVDADRMETAGYASDRPVAPNTTRAGRAQNRRTELTRTD